VSEAEERDSTARQDTGPDASAPWLATLAGEIAMVRAAIPSDDFLVLCGEEMIISSKTFWPQTRTAQITIKRKPETPT